MRELDLNSVVRETLTLYESLGSSIEVRLADELPPIIGDAALTAPSAQKLHLMG